MRTVFFIFLQAVILSSCTGNRGKVKNETLTDGEIRKEVTSVAEGYAENQLNNAVRSLASNGVITVRDSARTYVIDPAMILIGLIDEDNNNDAIVPLSLFGAQTQPMTEHLFIINTEGKFMLIRSVETDFRILRLRNRVITAELHTKPRNSPLYNCSSCKEIVNYQFKSGDLVKIQP